MSYKHILVATDLHWDALPIVRHALAIVRQYHAKLTIVNVIPCVPYYMASGLSSISDIEEQLEDQTKTRFNELKQKFTDVDVDFMVCHGSAKIEIIKVAKDIGTDLIVIGSHGQRGVQRLLGSTATGVLHRAPCDVLVVRSGKTKKDAAKSRLERMRARHAAQAK